jgi:hypothetical protein
MDSIEIKRLFDNVVQEKASLWTNNMICLKECLRIR